MNIRSSDSIIRPLLRSPSSRSLLSDSRLMWSHRLPWNCLWNRWTKWKTETGTASKPIHKRSPLFWYDDRQQEEENTHEISIQGGNHEKESGKFFRNVKTIITTSFAGCTQSFITMMTCLQSSATRCTSILQHAAVLSKLATSKEKKSRTGFRQKDNAGHDAPLHWQFCRQHQGSSAKLHILRSVM